MILPRLIVVCGAPASGKTTLARRLARELAFPLLEKDIIKESLAEALGASDREASKRIGAASFRVLYDLAFGMLTQGSSVMIEANLTRRFATPELERFSAISTLRILQCAANRDAIERRYRDRHAGGRRHTAHFDIEALPDLIAGLDAGDYDLTELGFPTITVCTDNGYLPAYHDLVASLRG